MQELALLSALVRLWRRLSMRCMLHLRALLNGTRMRAVQVIDGNCAVRRAKEPPAV